MVTVKDFILNSITMKNILDKYNIKTYNNTYKCPFHNDTTPSAKAYNNTYYCFACHKRWRCSSICARLF